MQLAVAGLGRMGRAIAEQLATPEHPVLVWNRTPGRADDLSNCRALPSPTELAAAADIVLTSLTHDDAVEAVYDGLLAGPVASKLFIETSTIRPETLRRLAARVETAGAALVDAPVAGGPAVARAVGCFAFVGGSEAAVDRARPVLARFCRRAEHVGPAGSGTVMKLVANLPIGVYFQALAEALSLGRHYGLDLERMLGIIADTPGALALLPRKVPAILGAEGEIPFDIAGVRKDLLAMTASALRAGVPSPAATGALTGYAAATAAGWGGKDFAQIIRFWSEAMSGQRD
jgi:3-hydroxyisobutyrate dehydrogenase-like beta-hydroxyacid dehydrogenase